MTMFRKALLLIGAVSFLTAMVPLAMGGGEPVAIGFIYVGPKDDYGYNQAHAAGAAAVKKMEGVKIAGPHVMEF